MSSALAGENENKGSVEELSMPEPGAEEQAKLTRAEEDLSMTATICMSAPPGEAFSASAQFLRRMGLRGLSWPQRIQRRLDQQYMVEQNLAGDVPLLFRGPGETGQLVLLEPALPTEAAPERGPAEPSGWDTRPAGMAPPSVVYTCFSLRTMRERVDKAGIAYQVGPSYAALRPVQGGPSRAPRLAADGPHAAVLAPSAQKKAEELTAADFELVPMPGLAAAGKSGGVAGGAASASGGSGRDLEGGPGPNPLPGATAGSDTPSDSLIRFTDPVSGLVVEAHESTARADGRLGQWLLLADMAATVDGFQDEDELDPAAEERQAARSRRRRRRLRQAGRRRRRAAAAATGSAPGVLGEPHSAGEDSAGASEVAVGLDDDEGRTLHARNSSFRTLSTQQKRQQRRQRGLVKAAAAAAGSPAPADDFVLDPEQVAQAVEVKEQAEVRAVENGLSLDTAVGELVGLMLPCEDVVAASAWWATMGFHAVGVDNIPHAWSVVSDGFFVIGLLPDDPKFRRFGLTFMSPVVSEGRRRMLRVLDVPVEHSMLGFEDEGATKTQLAAVGGWESCTALGGRLTWAPIPGAASGPGCSAVVMTGVEPLLTVGRMCTVAAGALTIACVVVWAILYLEGSLDETGPLTKVLQS